MIGTMALLQQLRPDQETRVLDHTSSNLNTTRDNYLRDNLPDIMCRFCHEQHCRCQGSPLPCATKNSKCICRSWKTFIPRARLVLLKDINCGRVRNIVFDERESIIKNYLLRQLHPVFLDEICSALFPRVGQASGVVDIHDSESEVRFIKVDTSNRVRLEKRHVLETNHSFLLSSQGEQNTFHLTSYGTNVKAIPPRNITVMHHTCKQGDDITCHCHYAAENYYIGKLPLSQIDCLGLRYKVYGERKDILYEFFCNYLNETFFWDFYRAIDRPFVSYLN